MTDEQVAAFLALLDRVTFLTDDGVRVVELVDVRVCLRLILEGETA